MVAAEAQCCKLMVSRGRSWWNSLSTHGNDMGVKKKKKPQHICSSKTGFGESCPNVTVLYPRGQPGPSQKHHVGVLRAPPALPARPPPTPPARAPGPHFSPPPRPREVPDARGWSCPRCPRPRRLPARAPRGGPAGCPGLIRGETPARPEEGT